MVLLLEMDYSEYIRYGRAMYATLVVSMDLKKNVTHLISDRI